MKLLIVVAAALSLFACKAKAPSKADIEKTIVERVKQKYEVDFTEVKCGDADKDGTVQCTAKFDGVDVGIELKDGNLNTTAGVITRDGLQKVLADMGRKGGANFDAIDCGPAKMYPSKPGTTVDCSVGPRKLTVEVKTDDKGGMKVKVIKDEGGPPPAAPAPDPTAAPADPAAPAADPAAAP
jgi:hypothetical protein